ncbi:MAG: hypothetical protein V1736_09565 [Pseudomonadota bacterium]
MNWRAGVFGAVFYALCNLSAAWGGDVGGLADVRHSTTEQKTDGVETSDGYSTTQNYYLTTIGDLTPAMTYVINLRANHSKTSLTEQGTTREIYRQGGEPQIEFNLNNPLYRASVGYQRTELWDGASISKTTRQTTDYEYARFDLTPREFPTLGLQWSHRENYDYTSPHHADSITDTYLANSTYTYAPFAFYYNYYLTTKLDDVQLGDLIKQETDLQNHNGRIDYSQSIWDGKIPLAVGYQANYSRSAVHNFSNVAQFEVERIPFRGLYAQDSLINPYPAKLRLESQSLLVDNDKVTPITSINIGDSITNVNLQRNIGLELTGTKSVKLLRIFINVPTSETGFSESPAFDVYSGNTVSDWTLIERGVSPVQLGNDPSNVYYYEVSFTATTARFFKVVLTSEMSDTIGDYRNIYVTEIEAVGDETEGTDIDERFDQGLNLSAGFRASPTLSGLLNVYLTRNDEEPESLTDSAGYLFSSLLSKSGEGGEGESKATTTRSWGPSVNWQPDSKLFTTFRFQRQDTWDTENTVDNSSNIYSVTLNSPLLDTLDATLSATHGDQYSFSEKESSNNTLLVSTMARLYDDVNMITDVNYTNSKTYATDSIGDTGSINTISVNGSINAVVTRRLNGILNYTFAWPSAGEDTNQQTIVLVYHPGPLLNLMASYQFADTGGGRIFQQNYTVDWLPVPVLNMNLTLQDLESGDTETQSVALQTRWQINRHFDLQFNYAVGRQETTRKVYTCNASLFLAARF